MKKEEELKECRADIETSRNYQKYIRFAEDESARKMKGIAAYIQERNEQDGDLSNGKEAIEWIVLDKEEDRLLVISKFALDTHYYEIRKKFITWKESSIRRWLNITFINETFDLAEQSMILEDTILANVEDRIFLLSIPEVEKYFDSTEDMKCQGTDYCYKRGVLADEEGNCYWWLRLLDESISSPSVVISSSDNFKSFSVDNEQIAVRPAMWLDLNP